MTVSENARITTQNEVIELQSKAEHKLSVLKIIKNRNLEKNRDTLAKRKEKE